MQAPFSIRIAIEKGFNFIWHHKRFLLGLLAIYIALSLVNIVVTLVSLQSFSPVNEQLMMAGIELRVIFSLISGIIWILLFLLATGTTRIFLDLYYTGSSSYNRLFVGIGQLITYILASVWVMLCAALGIIAFIIPGFIVLTMYHFYDIIIFDQHTGAFESLRISRKITKDCRLKLFLFLCVEILLGAISCGLLNPLILMARIAVYDKLKNR